MTEAAYDHPSMEFPSAGASAAAGARQSSLPLIKMSDLHDLVQPVEEWITRYPAAALASAFLVGVALACWIKRK